MLTRTSIGTGLRATLERLMGGGVGGGRGGGWSASGSSGAPRSHMDRKLETGRMVSWLARLLS